MINIVEYASHFPKQTRYRVSFLEYKYRCTKSNTHSIYNWHQKRRSKSRLSNKLNTLQGKYNNIFLNSKKHQKLNNHIVTTRLVNLISVQAVETFKMKCASKRALVLVVIASGILIATMADAASKYFHFMFCHFDSV